MQEKNDEQTNVLQYCNSRMAVERIALSEQSYMDIYKADQQMLDKIVGEFDELFNLHPVYEGGERSKILLFNKDAQTPAWSELEVHRWFESYLQTPDFSKEYYKSYMFGAYDKKEIKKELPMQFMPYYEYATSIDPAYNQVVVNWYERENDYIAAHSDWIDGMIDNYKIGILNLYGCADKLRTFKVTDKASGDVVKSILLQNGDFIVMGGKFQDEFRHEVEKIADTGDISRRIGITFRQYA